MKILHALAFVFLVATLSTPALADAPSPRDPVFREGTKWWKERYEQQVEQLKNNPCGVLFLGDSITHYWDREGKKYGKKRSNPIIPATSAFQGTRRPA